MEDVEPWWEWTPPEAGGELEEEPVTKQVGAHTCPVGAYAARGLQSGEVTTLCPNVSGTLVRFLRSSGSILWLVALHNGKADQPVTRSPRYAK